MALIAVNSDAVYLDQSDIIRWSGPIWMDPVINVVDAFYDYGVGASKGDFAMFQSWQHTPSINLFNRKPSLVGQYYGVKTANGGQAILDAWALAVIGNYGAGAYVLPCDVFYRRHVIELGDELRVSHPNIHNPLTGRLGLTNELMRVVGLTLSFGREGKVGLALMWVGAIPPQAAPTSGGAKPSSPNTLVDFAEYDNAASITVNTSDLETGTVTITTKRTTDQVLLTARQYLIAPSACAAPTIYSRLYLTSVGGTVLDGPVAASSFLTAIADKSCATGYYGRRGIVEHKVLHTPGSIGSFTYKLAAICSVIGGSSQDRKMEATVRSQPA